MNLGTARVIQGDARHLPLADNTVDLVVTSPPYFALRSYQDGGEHYAGQLGSEATPAEFVAALLEVTRECVRVLKPTGSLWVNLGDSYSSGGRATRAPDTTTRRRGFREDSRPRDGMRAKTLIGIPWRYALACIDDLGLILRAEVIWSKPNGLPESP
jgi:DNA modification methylase